MIAKIMLLTVLMVLFSVISFNIGFHWGKNDTLMLHKECPTGSAALSQIEKNQLPLTADVSANLALECFSHAAPIENSLYKVNGTVQGGVLQQVFGQLHHPDAPFKTELIIDRYHRITELEKGSDPYMHCEEIYLTRTGASSNMRNKCLGVAIVQNGGTSPYIHSHRGGMSAGLKEMYQKDFLDMPALNEEKALLPLFLKNMDALVGSFRSKIGNPILPNGKRRAVVVMVANEGVLDLVINFLCSCKLSGIDITDKLVVFLGQPELEPILDSLGVMSFYHMALGPIPKKAAGFYGDRIFSVMMWLKTTSVYVACHAGYDVLFQDTDLVWVKDPLPHLQEQILDIAFMDDGARTTRFTPFFENSGFYFMRHNERVLFLMEKMIKSMIEIAVTHSHQATLTRHITEAHHLQGLQIVILEQEDFPSGMIYHHNKRFIKAMKAHEKVPYVFHMCWTTSRTEKVEYFKDVGMWLLPEGDSVCEKSDDMLQLLGKHPQDHATSLEASTLMNKCCKRGEYWQNFDPLSH